MQARKLNKSESLIRMSQLLPLSRLLHILLEQIQDDGRQYNQQEIADKTGISRPVISHYLTGRTTSITVDNAVKIADFFGVPLEYFRCTSEAAALSVIKHRTESKKAVAALSVVDPDTIPYLNDFAEGIRDGWDLEQRTTVMQNMLKVVKLFKGIPPSSGDKTE